MRRVFSLFIVIVLVLIAIIVGSRNTQLMTINYLVAQSELKTSTFMMITLLIGFVLGIATMSTQYFAVKVKLSLLKRKLDKHKRDS